MWNSACQAHAASSHMWSLLLYWSWPRAASFLSSSTILRPGRALSCALKRRAPLLSTTQRENMSLSRLAWWPPIHHMASGTETPWEPLPSTRRALPHGLAPVGPTDSLQTEQPQGCRLSVTPAPAGCLQDFWRAGLVQTGWPPLACCRPVLRLGKQGQASPL